MTEPEQPARSVGADATAITAVFVLALGVRFYAATTVPQQTLDEPDVMAHAARLAREPGLKRWAFFSPELTHPLMRVQLARLGMQWFGATTLGARMPAVLAGAATVVVLYLLARALVGAQVALLASLLLALSQYHIGWSRLAVEEAPLMFFSLLSAWLLVAGMGRRGVGWWMASGAAVGLACLCKELALLLLVAYAAYGLLYGREWLRRPHPYLLAAAAVAVVALAAAPTHGLTRTTFSYGSNAREWCAFSVTGFMLWLGEWVVAIMGLVAPDRPLTHEELPPMHWLLGLVCFVCTAYHVCAAARRRRSMLAADRRTGVRPRAFLFCIFFAYLAPTLFNRGKLPTYIEPLDGFWWTQMALPVSMILAAATIHSLGRRGPILRGAKAVLLVWLAWHAWDFADRPQHYYAPRIPQGLRHALGREGSAIMANSPHRPRGDRYDLALGHGRAEVVYHGPRSILVSVELTKPDVLIVAQRYHPAWRSDQGRVVEYKQQPAELAPPDPIVFPEWYAIRPRHRGFLAVEVSRPGWRLIRLTYRNWVRYAGFAATLLMLLAFRGQTGTRPRAHPMPPRP